MVGDKPRGEGGRRAGCDGARSRGAAHQAGRGCGNGGHAYTAQITETVVETGAAAGTVRARKTAEGGRTMVSNLSQEQWTDLLNMLDNQNTETLIGKNMKMQWLLDMGASHHMSGYLDGMEDLRNIMPWAIRLPDGKQTMATKEGHVVLENNRIIRNVLYFPKLQCNLISVSQLIDDWNCLVTFTNRLCVIQDQDTRTLIGVGERHEGVYYFRKVKQPRVCRVTSGGNGKLWHSRLGHPSDNIDKYLQSSGICVSRKNKQTRAVMYVFVLNKRDNYFLIVSIKQRRHSLWFIVIYGVLTKHLPRVVLRIF